MPQNPSFQDLFETFGKLPRVHAEAVNKEAFGKLREVLAVPLDHRGRFILLKAPRAGHGKTHLLARVQHHLSGHEFIPLHAAGGSRIDAATVTDDVLRTVLRPLPASGGLTMLDLLARRLFSLALQPLVMSGEVPCQDRDGALSALRHRPVETFDFQSASAATAQWAKEHYDILGPRLAIELARRGELPIREVTFWVDVLFRFSSSPPGEPERLRALSDAVHSGAPADGEMMERLEALLGLLTLLTRVVLVADELEGFSADPSAALRFSAFAGALRQAAGNADILISLNEDVWQNAFVPRLSAGLQDRLSEVVVTLGPLSRHEMTALLESRAPGQSSSLIGKIDCVTAGTHARGILKAAGEIPVEQSDSGSAVEFPVPVTHAPEITHGDEVSLPAAAEIPVSETVLRPELAVEFLKDAPSNTGEAEEVSDAPEEPQAPGFSAGAAPVSARESETEAVSDPAPALEESPAASDQSAPAAGEQPAICMEENPDSPPSQDVDRVDELLRQFRDRYGRSGG